VKKCEKTRHFMANLLENGVDFRSILGDFRRLAAASTARLYFSAARRGAIRLKARAVGRRQNIFFFQQEKPNGAPPRRSSVSLGTKQEHSPPGQ
jgi:hypothetical protein